MKTGSKFEDLNDTFNVSNDVIDAEIVKKEVQEVAKLSLIHI